MVYYIGIDPGFKGAIGILDSKGKFLAVYDMPISETPTGKTKIVNFKRVPEVKQEVNGLELSKLMLPYKKGKGIIEAVHAMPDQGVTSVFNFGTSYGIALGVMQTLELCPAKISPHKWKGDLNLNDDKTLSIELAKKLFPEASEYLKLKKHDGRAESLLLAYYLKNILKESKK